MATVSSGVATPALGAEAEDLRKSCDDLKAVVSRLESELRQKEKQLERRSRLVALGELAAGVAHEIRNPLGGIGLYVELLRKDVQGDEEKVRLVEQIQRGMVALNRVVEEMLEFAKPREVKKSRCDIGDVVACALGVIEHESESRGVDVYNGCVGIVAPLDPNVMRRAFTNIALNAFQAMKDGGMLAIEAGEAELDGRPAVGIVFRDTGPGIPREIAEKVFDPFFTMRDGGTGLGLSIVHSAVESHGGTVGVRSAEGGGAVVRVVLPKE